MNLVQTMLNAYPESAVISNTDSNNDHIGIQAFNGNVLITSLSRQAIHNLKINYIYALLFSGMFQTEA